jgi:hypothetical protein
MNEKKIKDNIIAKYVKEGSYHTKSETKKLSILILCNPCHGFGDVIFAIKLFKYLKEWYNCKVKIGTTTPESFIKLGMDKKDIVSFGVKKIKQCRRFSNVLPEKPLSKFDLYFVAPLPADNEISQSDINKLTPYANSGNTFFFSEYNDKLNKKFDFNTGIGKGRDGIFLTKITKSKFNFKNLGKYALSYLSENIDNADDCFLGFLKLVTNKYNYKKFSVIAPGWVSEIDDKYFKKYVSPYYEKIILHTKDEEFVINDGKNVLHIRCDIFPVSNSDMLMLMKNSVRDILLTGDQSITDALSCCPSKNIFYQIAPWKKDFAENLAKELPNPYLSNKKSSCGTIEAIKYKSSYKNFIKEWDFRKLGKVKLDAVIAYAIDYLKDNQ